MKKLLSTLASLSFAVSAGAAEPPAKKPTPGDLHCIVGRWEGTGTLQMGKDTAPLRGRYECAKASADVGVTCRATITGIPDLPSYELTDLWGIDPTDDTIHWFTVTNTGETHDHKGRLTKDGWQGRFVGTQQGQPFEEVVDLIFHSKEEIQIVSVSRVGGVESARLVLTMAKQPEATRAAAKR
jgi:hypothetical protein